MSQKLLPKISSSAYPENIHAWLFTDGSCYYRDLMGGWGACVITRNATRTLMGCEFPTTVARCELLPVIAGLRYIGHEMARNQRGLRVCLVSDSESTVEMIGGSYVPDKNYDLWDAYYAAAAGMSVFAVWRERNTNAAMSYVDGVAVAMREQMKTVRGVLDSIPAPTYEHVQQLYNTTTVQPNENGGNDEDSAHN
jgi:ribonuclease HI